MIAFNARENELRPNDYRAKAIAYHQIGIIFQLYAHKDAAFDDGNKTFLITFCTQKTHENTRFTRFAMLEQHRVVLCILMVTTKMTTIRSIYALIRRVCKLYWKVIEWTQHNATQHGTGTRIRTKRNKTTTNFCFFVFGTHLWIMWIAIWVNGMTKKGWKCGGK